MRKTILYKGFLEVILSCIIGRGGLFRAARHFLT